MPHRHRRAAFTLIELLVVIGIIALLVALVAAVGPRVIGAGRASLTEGTMQRLTAAYAHLEQASGGKLPSATVEVRDPGNTTNKAYIPIVDGLGREGSDEEPMNSIGLFVLQLSNMAPEGRALIDGIDSSIVRTMSPHKVASSGTQWEEWDEPHRELVTVFDAWDAPLRYVHPTFDGIIAGGYPNSMNNDTLVDLDVDGTNPFRLAVRDRNDELDYAVDEIRRNSIETGSSSDPDPADSDGGVCPGSQPYFYSPGPDGKVGKGEDAQGNEVDYNKDNVYLIDPTFQDRG